MEACEVIRLFVNKAIVSAEPKRPGNPGYGIIKALRVLVYAPAKHADEALSALKRENASEKEPDPDIRKENTPSKTGSKGFN